VTTVLDRVVVGNGAAAAEAVRALREGGFVGRIDLFADGPHPPYNPMLGTYYVGEAIDRDGCFPFGGDSFYSRYRVEAHRLEPVVSLDSGTRTLVTASGEPYSYAECLVATGAAPAVPPVPGLDGPGVHVLRTFDDARRLRAAVAAARERAAGGPPPRALVLGASFAGLEVARVLGHAGLETTIVELEPVVLPRVAHPACAQVVQRRLRARGHELLLGAALESVEQRGGRLRVRIREAGGAGREAPADLVVVCAGSRPNLAFLAGGGFDTAAGLDVDERLRTAAPGLLAAGDVARTLDPVSGERVVVALWKSARRQGRAAGLTMAGRDARCPGDVPCNIQHAGDQLFASAGSFAAADLVDVDERGEVVAVLGFRRRRLVGFNLLGDVRRAGPLLRVLGRAPGDLAASGRVGSAVSLAAVREGMAWTTRSAG
jgi:NADPH-dependent 2,4-dienoyl-CoA reductase/sulfur reductase-like enzyme